MLNQPDPLLVTLCLRTSIILFASLITLLSSSFSLAEDTRKFIIDPSTTAINGVKITTTENEILKIFGKPLSVESYFGELLDKQSKDLNYNWIKFHIVGGEIYGLSCSGKKCETNTNILLVAFFKKSAPVGRFSV